MLAVAVWKVWRASWCTAYYLTVHFPSNWLETSCTLLLYKVHQDLKILITLNCDPFFKNYLLYSSTWESRVGFGRTHKQNHFESSLQIYIGEKLHVKMCRNPISMIIRFDEIPSSWFAATSKLVRGVGSARNRVIGHLCEDSLLYILMCCTTPVS